MKARTLAIILLAICLGITIFFLISISIDDYTLWGSAPIEFDKTGQVGDFIGGLVGTIISAAAFYYLYLTLNEQRQAITNQQKAYERERLESKFFELIKMHRENVSEMSLTVHEIVEQSNGSFLRKDDFEAKAVFNGIITQFFNCWNEIKPLFAKIDRVYEKEYKEMTLNNPIVQNRKIDLMLLAKIDICYSIVFYGVGSEGTIILKKLFKGRYKEKFVNDTLTFLSLKPATDKKIVEKWLMLLKKPRRRKRIELAEEILKWRSKTRPQPSLQSLNVVNVDEHIIQGYHNKYVKYYGGHQFRLGHYYRHLFQAVKLINNRDDIGYHEKYQYIKTLRAQLSTAEQTLLFLNSLSKMGYSWELCPDIGLKQMKLNRSNFELITKYNLIKNIPSDFLFGIPFHLFYPEIEFEGGTANGKRYPNYI